MDKARFFFDVRVDETDGTVVRRVYVVLVSPHRRARIPRFRPFFLLSLILDLLLTPRVPFLLLCITAHGQDDHPRSRVFGHYRQRQGENPRQRGHPAGSAAIDLRRKTIRRWPNFSRL